MKRYFIFILLQCILLGNYSGGSPGSSFKYGTNAREVALSQSTISTYNPGFNSFNNPAFLPNISNNEYGFSYFSMSLDRSVQSFSISRPLPPSAGISLSVFRSGTDNIISTSSNFGTPLGNISQSEGFGMLSFGINLGSLSGGFNIKAYFNNLDNYSGNGIGFDFGFLFSIDEQINVGLKLNNLGGSYSWDIDDQYEEDIPANYSLGISFNNSKNLLITSQLDMIPIKENMSSNKLYNIYCMGIEYGLDFYKIKNIPIILRSGLKFIDNKILYSFGFGLPINISEKIKLNIDYALDPGLVDEGFSHLFSFTIGNI